MKYTEEMASVINKLLQNNLDAEKGFRNAVDEVENEQLKALFKDLAQQKYDFAHELRSEVRSLGEPPTKGSSVASDLHRTWMNIRAGLASNSEKVVLAEAAKGEKKALEEYEEVIGKFNFPSSTESILERQKQAYKDSVQKLHTLYDDFL